MRQALQTASTPCSPLTQTITGRVSPLGSGSAAVDAVRPHREVLALALSRLHAPDLEAQPVAALPAGRHGLVAHAVERPVHRIEVGAAEQAAHQLLQTAKPRRRSFSASLVSARSDSARVSNGPTLRVQPGPQPHAVLPDDAAGLDPVQVLREALFGRARRLPHVQAGLVLTPGGVLGREGLLAHHLGAQFDHVHVVRPCAAHAPSGPTSSFVNHPTRHLGHQRHHSGAVVTLTLSSRSV